MTKRAGDHVQVLAGGYDLTGDSNKVTINDSRKMLETTAFGDAVQKFLPGQRQVTLDHLGYVDAANGRSHSALRAADLSGVVSVIIGENAAPVVGDPAYSLLSLQNQYSVAPQVGAVIPFTARFASRGALNGWGVALAVPVNITNTTTGAAVDQGAASSAGGAASLHILGAVAGDTYSILVEGADNAGFSSGVVTLATFTLNGSAIGSERVGMSGAIPRYVRWRATRSGSAGNTLRLAVALARF